MLNFIAKLYMPAIKRRDRIISSFCYFVKSDPKINVATLPTVFRTFSSQLPYISSYRMAQNSSSSFAVLPFPFLNDPWKL